MIVRLNYGGKKPTKTRWLDQTVSYAATVVVVVIVVVIVVVVVVAVVVVVVDPVVAVVVVVSAFILSSLKEHQSCSKVSLILFHWPRSEQALIAKTTLNYVKTSS